MRRERLYLLDVVAAADAIDQFLEPPFIPEARESRRVDAQPTALDE